MERRLLTPEEVRSALAALPGWQVKEGQLWRDFRFASFGEAFAFMTRVAREAEKLDHHPDWSNAYNRVTVGLSTHDLGGLSTLDVELARRIVAAAQP